MKISNHIYTMFKTEDYVMNRIRLALLSLSLMQCSHAWAAANCHVDFYNFVFGADVQTNMTVKSGKVCTSGFTIRGGGIQSMQVQQAASNGVAAVSGQRLAYKPNASFVGRDSFVIRISGETMGRYVIRGETKITVNVNVLP